MPQVEIEIGGRSFEVACQTGEEPFLRSAALMLDTEASALSSQIGRMPEARMLLMAGLMLADKTAALEDKVKEVQSREDDLRAQLEAAENRPLPAPERIEVPVIPEGISETMAELAARAEALAAQIEEKSAT
ncbi:MAG: cell division protein ZapA [Rhodobacteraceae bacterium]|nr:cell division protein ZapA [Paracoccaceae bacterium]